VTESRSVNRTGTESRSVRIGVNRPERKPLPLAPHSAILRRIRLPFFPTLEESQWEQISFLDHLSRVSKQLVVTAASRHKLFGTWPKFLCLSGAACCVAGQQALHRSEAAQRAFFFWQRAGPIVAHYKFTQVRVNIDACLACVLPAQFLS
jgi:hypothetical protein